mgnify:CR=1 FL=1
MAVRGGRGCYGEVLCLHLLHPEGLLLLLQLYLYLLLHYGLLLLQVFPDLLVNLPVRSLLQILLVHEDRLLLQLVFVIIVRNGFLGARAAGFLVTG